MTSIFQNKPIVKENNTVYTALIVLLALISTVLIMMPVIVCIKNGFQNTETAADVIYYILRGLFGISLIVGAVLFAVNKDIAAAALPCLVGFVMLLFPLYSNVSELTNAIKVAGQFSMSLDYSTYLISIGEYLLYTLLCLFTLLYSIGIFRYSVIIMVISVVASLATVFTSIDQIVTYFIPVYEVLCFAYAAIASLIPMVVVLSAVPVSTTSKYQAKRMK